VDGGFIEQALLRLAVLGSSFDYGLGVDYLVRAGAPAARAEWALEALLQAQLLVEARDRRADRLHFAHQAFVLAAQGGAERRGEPVPLLHRLAAEAKEAWAGNHRVRVAADLAEHYQQAGAPLRASGWLIQAAEAAGEAGERTHATALLIRADGLLAEQPGAEAARRRAEVWLGLAGAAFEAGQFERARTLLARVDKWTRQTRDLVVAARARILLAQLLLANGDVAQAARIFANAAKVAAGASEPKLQADARLGRARVALQMGRADVALSEFRAARDLLVPLGDPVAVAPAWLGIGGLVLEEGTASEARTALEAALDGYRRGEDWAGRARCHLLLAEVAQRHEGPSRVQAHLDEALAAFAGLGDRLGLARTHGRLARLHAEQGRWSQVQRHTHRAVTGFEALEQGNELARLRRNVGSLAVAAGELELARPLLIAGVKAATNPGGLAGV
jgi:tetratricopeptide (TPR) repeat protein